MPPREQAERALGGPLLLERGEGVMARRLVIALLLSGWLVGVLGCGSSGPIETTKSVSSQKGRIPMPPQQPKK